ncbi:uncharacterized protein LOC126745176 [Anthonomus grandis grandis]|uniref:uncharacterized protein LOC126745176 n=1 Tax=Anthonomus grandis grandis TaxID=2921223 RepID=UPI0021665000|nr:uncharacterized protein LOC126745176 [Anthonomus grandis grandis]
MYLQKWMLFLWALSLTDKGLAIIPKDAELVFETPDDFDSRQNDRYPGYPPFTSEDMNNVYPEERERDRELGRRCTDKMEKALETIRRRQLAKEKMFHLNGYSLHQQLRSAPLDMYVTDMRVRLPPSKSWVRVDKCAFNPINHSLETRLLFNDLTISGRVNLFNDGDLEREPISPNPEESCNMILRLRKAGIGFHTEPIRKERGQFNVKTDSHFLEPGFISVYAYGCEPGLKRRDFSGELPLRDLRERERLEEEEEEVSREMEDIFLRGIRQLLTSYMQRELQPAIKETLMKNMGYTISYG